MYSVNQGWAKLSLWNYWYHYAWTLLAHSSVIFESNGVKHFVAKHSFPSYSTRTFQPKEETYFDQEQDARIKTQEDPTSHKVTYTLTNIVSLDFSTN
jgi:uncharacterized membrane protein YkgB